MTSTLLCCIFLVGGIVAYGVGGANLATGSENGLRSALTSHAWWLGTGCQAAGFLLTLVSRRSLPMLFVQSAVVAALAITALIQHRTGARRLQRLDWVAIATMVLSVGMVGASTVPGPVTGPTSSEVGILTGCTLLLLPPLLLGRRRWTAIIQGCACGVGFGVMAVAARLLVADTAHPLWRFWELPWLSWVTGIAGVLALLIAQIHLTRALSAGSAVGVFSCMYGLATAFGGVMGWAMLGEPLRPGALPLVVVAVTLGTAATGRLLNHVEQPA